MYEKFCLISNHENAIYNNDVTEIYHQVGKN